MSRVTSGRRIDYAGSVHDEREIAAVVDVLRGGPTALRIGRNVKAMEARVAALFGKRRGVMCNSGSSALYLAVEVLDPTGAEQAVVVAECKRPSQELAQAVTRAVRAEIGVQLSDVVLIKRGTLAKTSSGKVRRREMKRRLEAGELELAVAEDNGGGCLSAAPPSSQL